MAASMKEVAEKAQVGLGTVSRVINGDKNVSQKTREKVLKIISETGYITNVMGARLRKNESKLIALLVPLIDHPFFAKFAYYAELELDKLGYSLVVISSQRRKERENDAIAMLQRKEVDGIIFVTHFVHNEKILENLPIVSVDRHLSDNTPYVTSDNYTASVKAVEFLYSKGCRKIAYLGGMPTVESEVSMRLNAYSDTVKKLGLEEYISNVIVPHGEEDLIAESFLIAHKDVDGVFVSGDIMAQSLYNKCHEKNIAIPEKLQIVSFDGALMQWSYSNALTCVVQPIEEMAKCAVDLVINRVANKGVALRNEFKSVFKEGNSTKK